MKKIFSALCMCFLLLGTVPALASNTEDYQQPELMSQEEYDSYEMGSHQTIDEVTGMPVQYTKTDESLILATIEPNSQVVVYESGPIQLTNVDIMIDVYHSNEKIMTLEFMNCSYQTYHNSVDNYYYHYWTNIQTDYTIWYMKSGYRVVDVNYTINNTNIEGERSRVTYAITYDYNQGTDYIDYIDYFAPVNN